jgi:hypothetical protein
MKYILTKHAKEVCKRLEISEEFVLEVCKVGVECPSKNYVGQMRHSGLGYCVVTEDDRVITIYKDKVITPLRDDQIKSGVQIKRRK